MPRSVLLRLTDIRDAIEGIDNLTADVPFDAFGQDWGMQQAVERGLEIVSEATRHMPNDYKVLALRFRGGKSPPSAICCGTNISVPIPRLFGTSSQSTSRLFDKQ